MSKLLVIGYGNELRSDDGVGPRIARVVASLGWPGVQTVVAHQLTPEMVDLLHETEVVVFVDASVNAVEVEMQWLTPSPASPALGHVSDPGWLLSLTQALFGQVPMAWLVTVPANDLGMGETLSDEAASGMAEALRQVDANFLPRQYSSQVARFLQGAVWSLTS